VPIQEVEVILIGRENTYFTPVGFDCHGYLHPSVISGQLT